MKQAILIVLFALFASVASAQQEVNGLVVYKTDNGIFITTTIKGDSLWSIRERFNVNEPWWSFVMQWKKENADIEKHDANWIFMPGVMYKVPKDHEESFLKLNQVNTSTQPSSLFHDVRMIEPEMTAVPAEQPVRKSNMMWWLLPVFAVGAFFSRRKLLKVYQPATGGPPINAREINPDMPGAAQIFVAEFEQRANALQCKIDTTREPLRLNAVAWDGEGSMTPTDEELEITQILERVGPVYRGRIYGGFYQVKYGDGSWQKRIGNGEFVYRATYNVRLVDGSTTHIDLLFLQVCGNDLRFGSRYLFGGAKIKGWEVIEGTQPMARTTASTEHQTKCPTCGVEMGWGDDVLQCPKCSRTAGSPPLGQEPLMPCEKCGIGMVINDDAGCWTCPACGREQLDKQAKDEILADVIGIVKVAYQNPLVRFETFINYFYTLPLGIMREEAMKVWLWASNLPSQGEKNQTKSSVMLEQIKYADTSGAKCPLHEPSYEEGILLAAQTLEELHEHGMAAQIAWLLRMLMMHNYFMPGITFDRLETRKFSDLVYENPEVFARVVWLAQRDKAKAAGYIAGMENRVLREALILFALKNQPSVSMMIIGLDDDDWEDGNTNIKATEVEKQAQAGNHFFTCACGEHEMVPAEGEDGTSMCKKCGQVIDREDSAAYFTWLGQQELTIPGNEEPKGPGSDNIGC